MSEQAHNRRQFIAASARGAVAAGVTLTAAQFNQVLGANERIRLGVIGTGTRGNDVLAQFRKQPGLEVVALCDAYEKYVNQTNAEQLEGRARIHPDYRHLLDAKEVDAVLITTPDHWHARMAIDACAAGKDVYCEKPLTYTIEEGRRIIKAVSDHRRVFQVGLQQRSGEHYAEAKRLYFDSGKIGRVTLVRTWWHGNTFHLRKPKFTEQPPGLDWKMFLGPVKYRPFNAHQFYNWRSYLDFGGGQITDLFTHWIDVVHWFIGEEIPLAANASGGVYHYKDGRTAPDTICIQLEYPKEWTATFEATLAPGGRGAAIEFMGTEGNLYIDRSRYVWTERGAGKGSTPAPPTERRADPVDMTFYHVKNFLECLRSRQQPNSDVVSGHRSALASHLGKMAYLRKARVTFDPAKEK